MSELRPILLDRDPGIDDALAILLNLQLGGTFTAIGSVHGNVPSALGASDARRILDVERLQWIITDALIRD